MKHKEKILKAVRETQQITHKEITTKIRADLSTEILQARREWQGILKVIYNQDESNQHGSHSDLKEKSKTLWRSKSWENSAPPNQLFNKC